MTNKQAYAGLLPCPFCGHVDELMHEEVQGWSGVVCCDYCGASGPYPQGIADSGDDAWNTRPEAAEAISSLLKALERIANHFDMDGYEGDAWKALALEMAEVARAALNSDAPLSIGEGL